MPESAVVQAMRENKAALLAREETTLRRMATEWFRIEKSLREQFLLLAQEVALMQANGTPVNPATVRALQRTTQLLFQVRSELGSYVEWVTAYISEEQMQLAELGILQALEAMEIVTEAAGLSIQLNRLPIGAIENLIGMAGDGKPLKVYFEQVYGVSADGIVEHLINGVVAGLNPRDVADAMAEGMGLGLQTAMNTARTETLRAYRTSSLMQYQNSGVVTGYRRMSARDDRVCAGCLLTDGMLVEDLSHFDEHNQGRCTLIPVVAGAEQYSEFQNGTDWFLEQDEATQRSILGAGRFNAWQNGASLEEMVTMVTDPTWGNYYAPTPVGRVTGDE
jgi:hypothetical protein